MMFKLRLTLVLFAVAFGLILSGCGDGKLPPLTRENAAEEIMKINDDFKKVEWNARKNGADIHIFHHPGMITSERLYFFEMGTDIKEALQKIAGSGTANLNKIVFFLHVPTRDKFGNEASTLAVKVFYSMETVKKINFENIYEWDLLNLADDYQFKRIGRELGLAYCQDNTNLKNTRKFCARVTGQ